MSKRYTFVWDVGGGEPVEAHLSVKSIAWLIGTIGARSCRIFTFSPCVLAPIELTPMINRQTHEFALMDPNTGELVDRAGYFKAE